MHRKLLSFLLVCLLLITAGCGSNNSNPANYQDQTNNAPSQPEEPEAPTQPEEPIVPDEPEPDPRQEAIDTLLSSMTLEEKVGQMFFVRCPDVQAAEKVSEYHLGGYLLFGRDFQTTTGDWLTAEAFTANVASYQAAADVPLLIGVDEEGGTVARATRNPNLFAAKRQSPQTIYAQGGMEAILTDTRQVNQGLLSYGINVNFAPVADVSTNSSDFIYDRTFGQDAAATAEYISQVVAEMDTVGIGSVLKHFPGYGSNADTHTGVAVDARSYDAFTGGDFLPFQAGIAAGADCVLVSHNVVQCMDDTLPASLSPEVHRVLREELGFDGVVFTDDLTMGAITQNYGLGEAAVLAVEAGCDVLLVCHEAGSVEEVYTALLDAVDTGRISVDRLDQSVRRILTLKQNYGLTNDPVDLPDLDALNAQVAAVTAG